MTRSCPPQARVEEEARVRAEEAKAKEEARRRAHELADARRCVLGFRVYNLGLNPRNP